MWVYSSLPGGGMSALSPVPLGSTDSLWCQVKRLLDLKFNLLLGKRASKGKVGRLEYVCECRLNVHKDSNSVLYKGVSKYEHVRK